MKMLITALLFLAATPLSAADHGRRPPGDDGDVQACGTNDPDPECDVYWVRGQWLPREFILDWCANLPDQSSQNVNVQMCQRLGLL
ncbi:hypothetical protein GCM10022280_19410 [Sphingomonas swuensis]|uniref:Uncharacterized protein n=1 Tax=Sphingomonas swuensis TaxID=977800 RepID=A0ABP7T1P8_9SPHN